MKRVSIVQITTTCGDAAQAERLVTLVLDERLAACGQIDAGIRSRYHWLGRVADDAEWRCTWKTSVDRAEACAAYILSVHTYENPELILATVETTEAYATWVHDNVRPAADDASAS